MMHRTSDRYTTEYVEDSKAERRWVHTKAKKTLSLLLCDSTSLDLSQKGLYKPGIPA
jgi:hypothetical protein